MLSKEYRLPSNQIKKIFLSGQKIRKENFLFIFTPSQNKNSQFCIIVKGAKNAVSRNRIKRMIRKKIYQNLSNPIPSINMVIIFSEQKMIVSSSNISRLIDVTFSEINHSILQWNNSFSMVFVSINEYSLLIQGFFIFCFQLFKLAVFPLPAVNICIKQSNAMVYLKEFC